MHQILQDPGLEVPEVTRHDEVAGEDQGQDEQQQHEERKDPSPDGGPAFGSERLLDGVEGGATGLLIIENSEPLGGAGFLLVGEGDLVELPFVMLDDIVQFEGEVRNDKMIGQL